MKKDIWHISAWVLFSFLIGAGVSYTAINIPKNIPELAYGIQVSIQSSTPILHAFSNSTSSTYIIAGDDGNLVETITIGFVGDIVPGPLASPDILVGAIPYTEKPDIMIGNLEGAITQHAYSKCGTHSPNCFAFNGDDHFLKLLASASFDVLNTSNNHFNDYGKKGREETIQKIIEVGIVPIGVKDSITYIHKNNLIVGLVSFSTSWWAGNIHNEKAVEKIVGEAKQNADIIVVVFHGGGEGAKYAHTPIETEWYLGENRGNVRAFAHKAIDAGADVVFGSGPHVLRGIEKYNDTLIAYSLGNFASGDSNLLNVGSLKTSAMIEVTLDKDGSFVSGIVHPFEINGMLSPYPDPQRTAISFMNNLSRNDFGERGVTIDSTGEIIFK